MTYKLLGNPESRDTKVENGALHIGEDETSEELKIKASISDLKKEIDIKIEKVQSVEMNGGVQDTYNQGDQYNPKGLKITVTYEDGYQKDIEYSEGHPDFSFEYSELDFTTKEQEITYKGYKIKQPLIIYGERILSESEVEVKGKFTEESILKLSNTEIDIDSDLNDKEIISAYDINVINGSYRDKLKIIFTVGDEYNGKKLNIRHNGNATEEYEVTVNEGKVTIEVDNLSPFIIYTEKVEEPNISDTIEPEVPDDSVPVIKPIEPTPDTTVQTKPNQPQQNTVSTEDKNHILLWGVLGIVSMSIVIMSVKKKVMMRNK